MNWSSQYPTQPGYYWLRNYQFRRDTELRAHPVLVDVNLPYDDFYFFGVETPRHRTDLLAAEWLGPISPPEEPQLEESQCMVGGHPPGCRGHLPSQHSEPQTTD